MVLSTGLMFAAMFLCARDRPAELDLDVLVLDTKLVATLLLLLAIVNVTTLLGLAFGLWFGLVCPSEDDCNKTVLDSDAGANCSEMVCCWLGEPWAEDRFIELEMGTSTLPCKPDSEILVRLEG